MKVAVRLANDGSALLHYAHVSTEALCLSARRRLGIHSPARRTAPTTQWLLCRVVTYPSPFGPQEVCKYEWMIPLLLFLAYSSTLEEPATVTQELTTFRVHAGRCSWERPHHPTADRLSALKQTAVTVSCYLDLRVVTGHSLADRGGCAVVGLVMESWTPSVKCCGHEHS